MVDNDLDLSEPKFRDRDDIMSIKLGVSRRNLMKQIAALGGLGSLAGCSSLTQSDGGGDGGSSSGQGTATETNSDGSSSQNQIPTLPYIDYSAPPTDDSMDFSAPEDPKRRFSWVVHDASIEFFVVVVAGMNDAMNQLGWTGEFIGPTENNETTQLELLRTKISSLEGGRDILATTVLNPDSYVDPVQSALDKGIPVVNSQVTVPEWDRRYQLDTFGTQIPYIGQPDWEAGNAVGEAAYNFAQGKFDEGTQIVFQPCIEVPGHPQLERRINGIINYMEAKSEIEVRDKLDTTTNVGKAKSRIDNALSANPGINVIIGTFSPALAAAGRVAKERGISDEVVVGGFDCTPITWQEVGAGNADFTTTQNPYASGYMTPHIAWSYVNRGAPMTDYETDVAILTRQDAGITVDGVTTSPISYGEKHIKELRSLLEWQQQNYENAESY